MAKTGPAFGGATGAPDARRNRKREKGMLTQRRISAPFVLLVSLLLLALLASGCGDDEEEEKPTTPKAAKPVTGVFTGTVNGTDALVAVDARPVKGKGPREVRVWVCQKPFGWFTGSAKGNQFTLSAAGRDPALKGRNGKTVEVKLAADAATGTMTLENGRSVSFRATRATGPAGLYDAIVSRDRRVDGPSSTGGRLRARLADDERGRAVISGTFTARGETARFKAPGGGVRPGHLARFVVLSDGRSLGKWQRKPGGSFSCWLPCF
jgi:hypothetical protein